jgi:hypothetical protein
MKPSMAHHESRSGGYEANGRIPEDFLLQINWELDLVLPSKACSSHAGSGLPNMFQQTVEWEKPL